MTATWWSSASTCDRPRNYRDLGVCGPFSPQGFRKNNVGDAVGGVMDFVGSFFSHSPAERGQFSGSGWTRVLTAGLAINGQLQNGLEQSKSGVQAAMDGLVNLPDTTASVSASYAAGAASAGTRERPIYMDGTLFGKLREMANGEAQIVVNDFEAQQERLLYVRQRVKSLSSCHETRTAWRTG